MLKSILIGTRPSRLALKQVDEIARRLPEIDFDIVPIETRGDKDKVTPLTGPNKDDFFTYEIEKALLEGEIDVAVHSAKDLEEVPPQGLVIAARTGSVSPFECLISKGDLKLKELPPGAVVGTSSHKRKTAVINFRRDLKVKDIRGNIDERIRQLEEGKFDAIIIAHAALIRLGFEERISEIIPPDIIAPHPLQGRLSIQVRADRKELIGLFGSIDGE
ncbi:MAG: hydroxymethylbilane synthase [Candidatus Omnitrophica bacterium]|nr:hydroxymethylbilane synthase [Candidatus Omnitrophota bacterium]